MRKKAEDLISATQKYARTIYVGFALLNYLQILKVTLVGPCHKLHDDFCREQYLAEKNKGEYPFEADWIHYLERLVQDLDRKIKKAHDRLDTQDTLPDSMVAPENREQLERITTQIQTLLGQMEQLGEEGRVDESQALMRVVDRLKAEKELLLRGGIAGIAGNMGGIAMGQEKKMRVCETCGAFLVVGDTEKRMASHLEGKQHQGYAKIRQSIEDYHKLSASDGSVNGSGSGGNPRKRSGGWERDGRSDRDSRGDGGRGGRDRYNDRYNRDNRDNNRDNRENRDRERRDSRDHTRDFNRGGDRSYDDRRSKRPRDDDR